MLQSERNHVRSQLDSTIGICLCTAFSCMLAAAEPCGFLLPLPTALAACLPPLYALAALAGCLLVYFLTGIAMKMPILICAAVLATLARFVLNERTAPWIAAAVAGGTTLISAVMFGAAGLLRGREWVLWGIASVVTALLGFCGARVRLGCTLGLPMRLRGKDGFYCGICYIAAGAALCSARIFSVSLGEVLLGFAVLSAAKRYHTVGGMVCGTLSACALLLSDSKTAGLAVMLGIGGMAAGVFSAQCKGVLFAGFQTICAIGLLLTEQPDIILRVWVNMMIGGVLFLFLPVSQLADCLLQWTDTDTDLVALAEARMEFLSDSIADVRGSAERIVNMLTRTEPLYPPKKRVRELVCAKCRSRKTCWEGDAAADTRRCFEKLASDAKASAPEGCLSPERITESFYRVRKENILARTDAARLRDSQTMLFSQMHIAEDLLRDAAKQVGREYDREQSRYVADILERFGIPVRAAAVSGRRGQRITMELYLRAGEELKAETVTEYLQDILQLSLICRETTITPKGQRMVLQSEGGFEIQTAAAQCAVHEDEPCGDCWDSFSDSEGNVYLAISDGMGTGRHAAVDSRIVLNSFRQLVQSGMECENAARMVNAIMLTKSGEERFATLDVAKINTENASAVLYKYGAGPTLLKHGDHVTLCQAATPPIGILPKSEPYSTRFQLEDGDLLFLLSDGLDDTLFPYVRQKLLSGESVQALTHAICAKAQREAKGAPQDDVTVLAAAVCSVSDF